MRRCVADIMPVLLLVIVIEAGMAMLLDCVRMNDQTRISNDETMTNDQMRNNHCYVASSFELRLLSSFELRHCQLVSTSPDATIR